jgi:hypothetical protein
MLAACVGRRCRTVSGRQLNADPLGGARMWRPVTVLIALLATTACPGISGPLPAPIRVTGTYGHPASGLPFPERVGEFQRTEVNQFDREGLNIGVGYNHEESGALVAFTVYVRPPMVLENGEVPSLGRQFAIERDAIRQYHPNASEVWSQDIAISAADRSLPGYAAEFHYNDLFNFAQRDVVSFIYLFDRDGWIIKYRITYREDQESSAERVFANFLKVTPWGTCATYRCTWRRL